MSTKDISDKQVVQVVYQLREDARQGKHEGDALTRLMELTNQPQKVCIRAMQRAELRGFIHYGVSIRTAWLSDSGVDLLNAS